MTQTETKKMEGADIWGLVSSISLVLGSLGTWTSLGPLSVGGMAQPDGKIVLALGLIASVTLAVHTWGGVNSFMAPIIAGFTALIALGIGISGMAQVMGASAEIFGVTISPSVGWGLVLTVIGSASLLAWSALTVILLANDGMRTEGEHNDND